MAVFKASFTRNSISAKATIAYIMSRPNREGERKNRSLFNSDGELRPDLARRMIDEAPKGTLFYRFIISPDRRLEDTRRDIDLRQVTLRTIVDLEERLGQSIPYAAAIHADHSPYRHLHLVALVRGKVLTAEDFAVIRKSATKSALLERHLRDLERGFDRYMSPVRLRFSSRAGVRARLILPQKPQVIYRRAQCVTNPYPPTCPRCGMRQSLSLSAKRYTCYVCDFTFYQSRFKSQEAGWGY